MADNLDKFVDSAVERQAETEVNAEQNIDQVQQLYLKFLNNPEERNPAIWDWFVQDEIISAGRIMDGDTLDIYLAELAQLIDLKFDDLQRVPVVEREGVWNAAEEMMSAAASRQAQIESGLVSQALKDGVENGFELAKEAAKLNRTQLQNISNVRMKEAMKERKEQKRNGS